MTKRSRRTHSPAFEAKVACRASTTGFASVHLKQVRLPGDFLRAALLARLLSLKDEASPLV